MSNLITGATGHVGNVLARRLLARGERVRAMVVPGDDLTPIAGLDVEVVEGDVLDPASLAAATAGINVVYHLAGIVSILPGAVALMRRVNVEGVRNVAAAAQEARVRRLVHVSSIHALARRPDGSAIDETTPLALKNAAGVYDQTKAQGTRAILDAVKQGLDAVIAFPTGIIGPYDFRRSEMGQAVIHFARERFHLLVRGAFDFVDVRDVVDGLILASERGQRGEGYILSGTNISIPGLKAAVQEAAGVASGHVILPWRAAMAMARLMQHVYHLTRTTPLFTPYSLQTLHDGACCTRAKAEQDLGYAPHPLQQTLRDTLSWRRGTVMA
jgi:dihydroflavonol-4-reductase